MAATETFRPNVRGADFRAIVYNAAKDGNLARLRIFLEGHNEEFLDECLNGGIVKSAIVIASRNGHLAIVRYLLAKGANALQVGTVSFDGETIHDAPPLWAAAAAGHMEVVRCLVDEAKVSINQTTATNSSPLRGACYDGHLQIVKFLVEHGAELELANRHGHTPLMIASFRKKTQVVQYLLQQKANPSATSLKGNTALHDAAEADSKEVCELLLQNGARLMKDDTGVSPLMGAAMLANMQAFPVLFNYSRSPLAKKEAYRMLGCTYVDKKVSKCIGMSNNWSIWMDLDKAVSAWREAMLIELNEKEQKRERRRRRKPLSSVFDGYREVMTTTDLETIRDNPDGLRMQSLIVRERILGKGHPDVHYFLRLRGAVYCDMGHIDRCFSLWMHACTLQQRYLDPLHVSTMATLQTFYETFALTLVDIVNDGRMNRNSVPITFHHINGAFDRVCVELERLASWGQKPLHEDCTADDHEHDVEDEKRRLATVGLELILVNDRLNLTLSALGEKTQKEYVDLSRFHRASTAVGVSLLHIAVSEPEMNVITSHLLDDLLFPSLYCVELLLALGVDVNVLDTNKNTPLHILLNNRKIRLSIAKILIEAGSYLYSRNRDDVTCMSLLVTRIPQIFERIEIGKYMSLLELSALSVRRNNLPYQSFTPAELHSFIDNH